MNRTDIVTILTIVESLIWIAVLFAIYTPKTPKRLRDSADAGTQPSSSTPKYWTFAAFAILHVGQNGLYLALSAATSKQNLSAHVVNFAYSCVYWPLYVAQVGVVFLIMAALIRTCLRPLPGLSGAAIAVFRWTSIVILTVAVTAHLPLFKMASWRIWLTEMCVSFVFCICSFELTLLALLLVHMRKLGLFVRSRVMGFALGLAIFGMSDYAVGFTLIVRPEMAHIINIVDECFAMLAATIWLYYIVMPEPERQPHSLSPASNLMKWNEVALKLGMGGRQAEQVPFISGVESKVDAVLDRFKARAE